MAEAHGLMPHGHPRSRDWGRPDYDCKATQCIFNSCGKCVVPSKCEIDEEGKCTGYSPRKIKKEREGD